MLYCSRGLGRKQPKRSAFPGRGPVDFDRASIPRGPGPAAASGVGRAGVKQGALPRPSFHCPYLVNLFIAGSWTANGRPRGATAPPFGTVGRWGTVRTPYYRPLTGVRGTKLRPIACSLGKSWLLDLYLRQSPPGLRASRGVPPLHPQPHTPEVKASRRHGPAISTSAETTGGARVPTATARTSAEGVARRAQHARDRVPGAAAPGTVKRGPAQGEQEPASVTPAGARRPIETAPRPGSKRQRHTMAGQPVHLLR